MVTLQGGGVFIDGGTANFNDCQIYSNKAEYVSACLLPFPELLSMAPMDQCVLSVWQDVSFAPAHHFLELSSMAPLE